MSYPVSSKGVAGANGLLEREGVGGAGGWSTPTGGSDTAHKPGMPAPPRPTGTGMGNWDRAPLGPDGSPGGPEMPNNPTPGIPTKPAPEYDPNQPVYAGPDLKFNPSDPTKKQTEIPNEANFLNQTTDIYGQNSLQVQASRNAALERFGGQGLLYSDMAMRGGEGAAFDKSMELARPDAMFRQDLVRSEQDFNEAGGLANQSGNIAMQQTGAQGQVQGALNQQNYQNQLGLNEQNQHLDAKTKTMMQGFSQDTLKVQNDFTRELKNLGFSQEMQSTLLATMTSMINNGNSALTMLATSPEATQAETDAIRQSIINGLTTYVNIWKGSAGSDDTFDFSGIGG